MQKVKVLNIKQTKRSAKCSLCRGNSGVIRKYKLFICRHCFREKYTDLGWVKEK